MSADRLNLLNFSLPRIRLLHLSWVAFFISFALWFSHAPLMGHLRDVFDLTGEQVKALLILNVALTIPARVVIGSLVDRFGPRRVFSTLLMSAALPCWAFALSNSFEQLAISRLLLGFVAAIQLSQIWQVNRERWQQSAPEQDSYPFKQVAILNLSYFITFGSELAVNSMLPLFFLDTFSEVTPVTAGLLASAFAFTNLVARPGGGWLSDRIGRKKSLTILFCGLLMGFVLLSQINSGWPVLLAMAATMVCSCFIQGGGGAIFATVPLIKRRLTGQISGMVGAYGNAGAVVFLTALTFVDASTFFLVIAACATAVLVAVQFLDEPKGHIAEVDEDGRVQLIEVS